MNSKLKENKTHGTQLFPFQHYRCTSASGSLFIPCHWHPEVEIIYVLSGEIDLLLDGAEYSLSDHGLCFVNSGALHQISSQKPDTVYYSYVFALNSLDFFREDSCQLLYLDPLRSSRRFPSFPDRNLPCYGRLTGLVETLIQTGEDRPACYQLITKSVLYEIIALLYQDGLFIDLRTKETSASSKSEDIRNLLLFMQHHYKERIYLKDAALYLHVSPKYFCTYFKSIFGKSFTEYLNHLRVEQACLLLKTSDLSVMDIGFEVGYDNFSYFIKSFKQIMGLTPGAYRREAPNA